MANKNFIIFFIAQLLTNFTDAFNQLALIALIIANIDKPGAPIALEFFFYLLPSLIFTPIIGKFIDKYSYKNSMIMSGIYRFILALLFITIVYLIFKTSFNLNLIFLYSFLIGTGQAVFYPSKMATVPQVVAPIHVKTANALVSGTGNVTATAGAVIAALIVSKLGIFKSLIAVSFSYIIATVLFCYITVNNRNLITQKTVTQHVILFLKNHKKVLEILLIGTIVALFSAIFFSGISTVATNNFNVGIIGLSNLRGILGIGGLFGIGFAIMLSKKVKFNHGMAISFVCLAFFLFLSNLCNSYIKAVFLFGAIGLFAVSITVSIDMILQKLTKDSNRGSIFTIRAMLSTAATLLGTLFVSLTSNSINQFLIFKFISALCIFLATFYISYNKLRITKSVYKQEEEL